MNPLIAVSGKKFSGKTTLAQSLSRKYNIPVDSFARALKDGCRTLGVEIDGPNKDVKVLQDIGVYFREQKGDDWWVRTLLRNHEDFLDTGLVVDDVRFPNEYEALRDLGFLTVRCEVSRDEQLRRAEAMGALLGNLDHISETALDDLTTWDITFEESVPVIVRELVIGMEMDGTFQPTSIVA